MIKLQSRFGQKRACKCKTFAQGVLLHSTKLLAPATSEFHENGRTHTGSLKSTTAPQTLITYTVLRAGRKKEWVRAQEAF